ncbi:hypothetical protein [Fredinandcohnia quinoae]|uniref:Uncharacterized protein n=1 Tax=Fredinandcohnia quinoae TaxID=2918902 RepID=A0AAW5E1P8_9BACI|nr:hypothetical protein [Fredinandcohnia sp. SECRCQ15]MCH1626263.1 hypothetical protein [Fredinandcohnia sp. SECRCQ15]
MSKFDQEMDRFVTDYFKEHENEKAKIQKWGNETEKELTNLDLNSIRFEREIEKRFNQLGKWLENKRIEIEGKFGESKSK